MDDKQERKLTVIERTEEAGKTLSPPETSHHTNPIMKKLMPFHLEKASKFL